MNAGWLNEPLSPYLDVVQPPAPNILKWGAVFTFRDNFKFTSYYDTESDCIIAIQRFTTNLRNTTVEKPFFMFEDRALNSNYFIGIDFL